MLARPLHGLAAFLQAHFQASLKMDHQKLRSIRFAYDQHWPRPSAGERRTENGERKSEVGDRRY